MISLALSRPRAMLAERRLALPPDVLGLAVALFAAALLLRAVPSGDLGWHLRTGAWILSHHAIPTADIYSFTRLGAPWVEQEWLWQVTMALVNAAAGQVGVAAANAVLAGATIGLVYVAARLRGSPHVFALAGTVAALAVMMVYSDARPSLLIGLCSSALIALFEAYRRSGNWRWLIGALAVEAVWANCHGSYGIGFGLCGVYALAALWEGRRPRAGLPWAILLAGLMTASLLNPLGPGLWHFTVVASQLTFNREFVGEWKALDLGSPVSLPIET
ncbi:MAG TPA: hypothetical protein VFS62_16100, partial [Chloroflexota bacterium]|nr:hypothetical protein [Chloroflexota bacterium]